MNDEDIVDVGNAGRNRKNHTMTESEEAGTPFLILSTPARRLDGLMDNAHYEEESGEWFGEITDFDGLYGHGATREAARDDLRAALQERIFLAVWQKHPLPTIATNIVSETETITRETL